MPRTGRPKADNAKDVTIRCRITSNMNERLEKYCKDNHTTKSAVMIKGIETALNKKTD